MSNLFFLWKKRAVLLQIADKPKPIIAQCKAFMCHKSILLPRRQEARGAKLHEIYKIFNLVKCMECMNIPGYLLYNRFASAHENQRYL